MSNCFDINVLSSSHINFLLGAGVNGKAFPQLKSFTDTLSKIEELGGNIENGLESGIDSLSSSAHKKIVKDAIEGFNRQLRKVTKSKTVFPSDDSLLKMLYLATMDITKKWTGRRRDWSQIRAQLEIYFEERLEKAEF